MEILPPILVDSPTPDVDRMFRDAIDALDAARLAGDRARRLLGECWTAMQRRREIEREAEKLAASVQDDFK